jgi:hypothetical protein
VQALWIVCVGRQVRIALHRNQFTFWSYGAPRTPQTRKRGWCKQEACPGGRAAALAGLGIAMRTVSEAIHSKTIVLWWTVSAPIKVASSSSDAGLLGRRSVCATACSCAIRALVPGVVHMDLKGCVLRRHDVYEYTLLDTLASARQRSNAVRIAHHARNACSIRSAKPLLHQRRKLNGSSRKRRTRVAFSVKRIELCFDD